MSVDLDSANCRPTRLIVYLNARRLWLWHIWLLKALNEIFKTTEVRFIDSGPPLPNAVKLLLTVERLLFGLSGEHACDLIEKSMFSSSNYSSDDSTEMNETVLNLSGSELSDIVMKKGRKRILRPFFDGVPTEDALIDTLLDERVPVLTVNDVKQLDSAWVALPAVENRRVLTRALDNMFSTLMRLCIKAVAEANSCNDTINLCPPSIIQANPMSWSALRFVTKSVASKALAKLTNLCIQAPHWFVLWRWTVDDRVQLTCRLPRTGYHRLHDDGRRFYADPFVIDVDGCHHVFLEEFDYALGRGVISTTIISQKDQPEVPRVVLDRPYHLSFPFVFTHAGQIWMIPESSAARTVELYRAEQFPNQWVLEVTLLRDISVADAVVFVQDGHWWMLASTVERQSSSWDSLSIFHAPDLLGPWNPHTKNPVLIDSRAARSAGNIFRRAGRLWRPAQDCSGDYGSAITLCCIDKLDTETYAQSTRALLKPGSAWHSRRMHTLNWAAGLEVIDGWGRISS